MSSLEETKAGTPGSLDAFWNEEAKVGVSQLPWAQEGGHHSGWLPPGGGIIHRGPWQGCRSHVFDEGKSHFDIFLLNRSILPEPEVWHRLIEQKKKSDLPTVGTSVLIKIRKSNWRKMTSGKRKKHMFLIVWGECFYEKRGCRVINNSGTPYQFWSAW